MKKIKIPLRTCVVSKERLEKKELLRVVRMPDGKVIVDDTLKASGRGCYLKKDKTIIEKAKKYNILEHNLGVDIDDYIYEELLKRL